MNIEITRMSLEHLEEAAHIQASACKIGYRGFVPDSTLDAVSESEILSRMRIILAEGKQEYYMLTVNGIPAGIARIGCENDKSGFIHSFYFNPDFWGLDHSSELMKYCINRLKALGCNNICLWVLKDNVRGRRFYEKHGFIQTEKSAYETIFNATLEKVLYSYSLNDKENNII